MKTNRTPRIPLAPGLDGLQPYRVAEHPAPVTLRLSGNEGPEVPATLRRFADPFGDIVRCYPRTDDLEAEIAERLGLDPARVLLTGGADDALARAISLVAAPDREILVPAPTFEMIERYVQLMGADLLTVPWWREGFPVAQVLESLSEKTVAVVLVTPNNPTGQATTQAEIQQLLAGLGDRLLIVDQAYGEFAEEDTTPLLLRQPNVIITRTLSKAFGLAGLRIGIAIAPAELVDRLRTVGQPYPVAGPSLAIAGRVLADDGSWQGEYLARIREERDRLGKLLTALKQLPIPSHANFVLCEFEDAAWVADAMAGLGVAVRRFPGRRPLERSLRISLPGNQKGMERLERSLRAILAPEALLFDMDGVIANVRPSYRRAICETASDFGVPVTDDEIETAKAAGDANNDWILTWRLICGQRPEVDYEEVRRIFEDRYQGTPQAPGLWREETLQIPRRQLERLASWLPLAVVTGRPRRDAERFLAAFDLEDLFPVVISMEDGPAKPAPFPVLQALQELGVERAWMVGDTPDDIRSARAAGVVPLGFSSVPLSPVVEQTLLRAGAARVLTDLSDLAGWLPASISRGVE